MTQYEIWWAELPAPIGTRPVLLLSRPDAYDRLSNVIVAQITTKVRGLLIEVPLGEAEGLDRDCVANLDNIHVMSKSLLVDRIGSLGEGRFREVKRALGFSLNINELKGL